MKPMQLAWQNSVILLFLILGCSFSATAQTVQYVTLYATNNPNTGISPVSLPLQTNQVVSLVGLDQVDGAPTISGNLPDGNKINLFPYYGSGPFQPPHIFTGLTNIAFNNGSSPNVVWATFQITTPVTSVTVITNSYIPADAVVIPASATGNVQIILESSTDLVNWTAANPGTYGASSATNRFFRVRAVHN